MEENKDTTLNPGLIAAMLNHGSFGSFGFSPIFGLLPTLLLSKSQEITWQDIEMILQISQDYDHELMTTEKKWVREEYYSEILQRYNEWKKQK